MSLTIFLSEFRLQLKGYAYFLMVAPILWLLAVLSFPFQPERLLVLAGVALCVSSLIALIRLMTALNKDRLLSRISGTPAASFTFDADFLQTVGWLVAPLVLVLLGRLPNAEFLYGWMGTFLAAFRHH